MTGGGIENVRELQEEKFRFQRQKEKVEERLNHLIRSDLAFALAGEFYCVNVSERVSGARLSGRSGSLARITPERN